MTGFVMFFISTKRWLTKAILFAALLAVFVFTETDGQVLQTERYEYHIGGQEKEFDVIPAGFSGLYLQRYLFGPKGDQIQIIKLDTAFKETWSGFLSVEKNYMIMGRKAFEGKLFLLLRYKSYTKNNLLLYSVNDRDGTYVLHTIRGFIPMAPSEFEMGDSSVIIGGYYNRVPVVLHYSFRTLRSKVLPGLFNESGELNQIRMHVCPAPQN